VVLVGGRRGAGGLGLEKEKAILRIWEKGSRRGGPWET